MDDVVFDYFGLCVDKVVVFDDGGVGLYWF